VRIAVCYFGLVGGVLGKSGYGHNISPEIGYYYYKKNLLNQNENVDIFMHSWSVNSKDELIDIYKPKKYIFQNQIHFNPWKLIPYQIFHLRELLPIFLMNYAKIFKKLYYNSFISQSYWYSIKSSINLAKKYEKENKFKYDYIFVTRFDVAFFTEIIFRNYDPEYFYVSNRNHGPKFPSIYEWIPNKNSWDDAYGDLWYFSNSDNIGKLGNIYDNLTDYSLRPPYAALDGVNDITNKVRKVLHYGVDYFPIRLFYFGKPY